VYNTHMRGLDEAATDLKTTCEYGERALTGTGNSEELLQLKNSLQRRLSKGESKDLPDVGASLNVTFAEFSSLCELASNLGKISISISNASLCTAAGAGLARITKNSQASFVITARDKFSQPILEGGEAFVVGVEFPNGEGAAGIVKDLNNGTYSVTYSTKFEGLHKVSITLNGEHIEGSPFNVLCAQAKDLTFEGGEPFTLKKHGSNGWNFVSFTSTGWKSGKQYIELKVDTAGTDKGGIVVGVAPKDTAANDYKSCIGIALNAVAYHMSSFGFINNERFNNDDRIGIALDLDGDGKMSLYYRRAKWTATGIKKNLSSWQELRVCVFLYNRNDKVSIVQQPDYPVLEG